MRLLILLLLTSLTAAALDKAGADAAVARGWDALAKSDTDPKKSVDAALAFTEALNFYRTTDDSETCRELQSNIFWCKKRMDLNDLSTYVAAKGHESASALVVVMNDVTEKPLAESEADKYFAKVQKFAQAHPSDHLKIAIQYFEIASRFPGTQIAADAQKLSLAAQVKIKGGARQAKVVMPESKDPRMGTAKDVQLFMMNDFKGGATTIKSFDKILDFNELGFPNDALRSIKIPRGVTVTIFEHEHGGGRSKVITEDMVDLKDASAMMSSLYIERTK